MPSEWIKLFFKDDGSKYTRVQAASPVDPLPVGASTVVKASFTRPANTTAYATGQLVANSTTAASVVPLNFTVSRMQNSSFSIRRVRLKKSGTSVTNASFRVHLFNAVPTVATTGDGGTVTSVVSGSANAIGRFDVTIDQAYADGSNGSGVPTAGGEVTALPATGTQLIYALVEAKGAYTPVSGEVFTVELEILQN